MTTVAEEIVPRCAALEQVAYSRVALLTGGIDRPYAYGLAMALVSKGVCLDVIGSDEVDSPEMHTTANLSFRNLWPSKASKATRLDAALRILRHYVRLIRYAAVADADLFHILWNSKVQVFDRTLLMLYYKMLGKKIALTVHNVNQARRDSKDSWLNRITLKIQYRARRSHVCSYQENEERIG